MIDQVEVKATYQKASQVPRIGQRKQMRVNGRIQQMTLNTLVVEREWNWDDDRMCDVYTFDSKETWGAYRIG